MRTFQFLTVTLLALFLCTSTLNAQTPAQNKAATLKILAAVDAGDLDAFAMYVSPSMKEHTPPPPGMPAASSDFELDKILIAAFHKGFPDAKSTVINIAAEADKVIVHTRFTGTNKGEFMGMPATNKAVSFEQVEIIRFDATGKAVEHWNVADNLGMMQQLGIIPSDKH